MSKHDDRVYLGHILESIQKIEKYVEGCSFADFEQDNKTIDAVIRNFEIIGEASNNISDDFRGLYPHVDFRSAASMRNRLAHGYDDINLKIVWDAIKQDFPALKKEIENI